MIPPRSEPASPSPPSRAAVIVVKVGGSAGIDRAAVARDVAEIAARGERVVLVHGASSETDALASALGHPARTVVSPSGQQSRRTDRRTLELFAMAALGVETFAYVELLRRNGARAVGVFGLLAGPRKSVRALEDGKVVLLRDDYTGKVETIDVPALRALLDGGSLPVLPPLALSPEGEGLNVDGDRAAAAVAAALEASTLVVLSNVPGLLRDVADAGSVVATATLDEADALAHGRMKKKAMAAREALDAGVANVVIASGRVERPVTRALAGEGTTIRTPGAQTEALKPGRSDEVEHPGPREGSPRPRVGTEDAHTSGLYQKRPLAIVRGEGATLWDADGNAYIDCVGGQGSANLGHGNAAVADAIAAQARTLASCTELFYNDRRAELYDTLAEILPPELDRVFLCNSGTEAVEAALKFARMATGRQRIVAAMRGFHGKTMGALAATWGPEYRAALGGDALFPGAAHVPFERPEALAAAITDDTAAFVLELVQGEGGVRPASEACVREAARVCRERGAMLVIDEVQTGFCRTGTMFAIERYGVVPDVLCLAKSIAGGMPMGATAFSRALGDLPKRSHSTTFGGNPLACAASIAAISEMRRLDLARCARERGEQLLDGLRGIENPKVREVRGLGLLVGIELKENAGPAIRALQERGVLALGAGPTVVRYLPPLVITAEQIDRVIAATAEALS